MTGTGKALRVGVITAAVVGTVGIPATVFASSATGLHIGSFVGSSMVRQVVDGDSAEHPAHQRGFRADAEAGVHLEGLAASLGVSVDVLQAAIVETRTELAAQRPERPEDREAFHDLYLATLAAKLNVTVDALQAAQEENRPERPTRPERSERPRGPALGIGAHLEAVATALGVTPEALQAAVQAARESTKPDARPEDEAAREALRATFVATLAANLGLSVEQVQAALDAAQPAGQPERPTTEEQRAMLEPRLALMVESGKLTQAQADQILADLEAGKPVFEVLRQFLPRLGGDHPERGWRRGADAPAPADEGTANRGPRARLGITLGLGA